MLKRSWPRSRYWLNHFLQTRHRRPKGMKSVGTDAISEKLRARLYQAAVNYQKVDPAFAQSLRLFSRALAAHQASHLPGKSLASKCLAKANYFVRKHTSLRFELAVQLLSAMIDETILANAIKQYDHDQLRTLQRERLSHIHFLSERLTYEFANINFIRRNIRRAIFRILYFIQWRFASRRRVISGEIYQTPLNWHANYRRFDERLKQVIPYRREELLKRVRQQEQQPFQECV